MRLINETPADADAFEWTQSPKIFHVYLNSLKRLFIAWIHVEKCLDKVKVYYESWGY